MAGSEPEVYDLLDVVNHEETKGYDAFGQGSTRLRDLKHHFDSNTEDAMPSLVDDLIRCF